MNRGSVSGYFLAGRSMHFIPVSCMAPIVVRSISIPVNRACHPGGHYCMGLLSWWPIFKSTEDRALVEFQTFPNSVPAHVLAPKRTKPLSGTVITLFCTTSLWLLIITDMFYQSSETQCRHLIYDNVTGGRTTVQKFFKWYQPIENQFGRRIYLQ